MIYFDNNSTTKCDFSLEDIKEILDRPLNPSSLHAYGRFAKGVLEKARRQICDVLGVDAYEATLVFTASGTEANNLIVKSFQEGDILACSTEHTSILSGDNITQVSVNSDGVVSLEHLTRLLKERDLSKKALVCVMSANNETGALQPLKEIRNITRKYGAYFHSDCVQILGKYPFNFGSSSLDSMSISAHKFGGVAGIGALVFKNNLPVKPQVIGGGQEKGIRSGTESVILAHLFAKATQSLESRAQIHQNKLKGLRDHIEKQIKHICPDVIFASQAVERLSNTSMILMPGVPSEIQLVRFDLAGFAVSSGSACSSGKFVKSRVLKEMGFTDSQIASAIRVSLGIENTLAEVDLFINAWEQIYKEFHVL